MNKVQLRALKIKQISLQDTSSESSDGSFKSEKSDKVLESEEIEGQEEKSVQKIDMLGSLNFENRSCKSQSCNFKE